MRMTIAALRRASGLTQRDVAEQAGVSQSTLARHESRQDVSADDKARLAALFGKRVDDIEWQDTLLPALMFIVVGNTGEHDRQEWLVAAYPTSEAAQAHVAALKEWADSRFVGRTAVVADWQTRDAAVQAGCPLDPCFECADNGTDYEVVIVPVMTEAPEDISVPALSSV